MSTPLEITPLPPLGVVPAQMTAAVIRPERYGPPADAIRLEQIAVPPLGPAQVLVMVMAAGVNYNNVWASLGRPLDVIAERRRRGDREAFHVGGSEAAGIVWAVGDQVRTVRVGDHVVLTGCRWDENAEDVLQGAEPLTSTSQSSWGYETNYGSFAQFTRVEHYQCLPKPRHLTWEQAACFLVSAATAYRQLCGWPPHVVEAGDPVLIWGGAGGLGSMAIQIVRHRGGEPVVVVSSDERAAYCRRLGAVGVIDRRVFTHWGPPPALGDAAAVASFVAGLRAFAAAFAAALGRRARPRLVLEHPGAATLATSLYLCDNAGMVVSCGATTGYLAGVDLRYVWMKQKRLQGSHYADLQQCREVCRLVDTGAIEPCLTETLRFDQVGHAHQLLYENRQPPGKMAILVNAARAGLVDWRPESQP